MTHSYQKNSFQKTITGFICSLLLIMLMMVMQTKTAHAALVDDFRSVLQQMYAIVAQVQDTQSGQVILSTQSLQPEIYLSANETVLDQSGNDFHPTWRGGEARYGSGVLGEAFVFDGQDEYVRFPHIDEIVGGTEFTGMLWAKRSSDNDGMQYLFSRHITYEFALGKDELSFSLWREESSTLRVEAPFSPGDSWHHYAFSYDGRTLRVYVDGNLVGEKTGAPANIQYGNPGGSWALAIGRGSNGRGSGADEVFDGSIDEVQVFSGVVSASDIASYVEQTIAESDSITELSDSNATDETDDNDVTPVDENEVDPVDPVDPVEPDEPVSPNGKKSSYVDARLTSNCFGTYDVRQRACTSGGSEDAYTSILSAVKNAEKGETIWIRGGTYQESVRTDRYLPEDVTISGYQNEKAVMTGAKAVDGWRQCTSQSDCGGSPYWEQIYRTEIDSDDVTSFEKFTLLADGERLPMAQYPDQLDPFTESVYKFIPVDESSYGMTQGFRSDQLDQSSDYWNGTLVRFWTHGLNNTISTKRVADFESTLVTFDEPLKSGAIVTKGSRPDAYSFINSTLPEVFDRPGEYVIDETKNANNNYTIYFWPENQSQLTNTRVLDKTIAFLLIWARGITIENLEIVGYSGNGARTGGISAPLTGLDHDGITLRNLKIHNISGYAAIQLFAPNVLIENVTIYDGTQDTSGIRTHGRNVVIRDSTVADMGRTAIYFGGVTNGVMLRNTVTGNFGNHGNGISVYAGSRNILIKDNRVITRSSIPLTLQRSRDITILGNVFDGQETLSLLVTDWGGLQGTINFLNNTVIGSSKNSAVNLSIDAGDEGQVFSRNNIIDGGRAGGYNTFVGLAWNQKDRYGWSLEENSYVETDLDKLFVDHANDDYRLLQDSVAVNSGDNITAALPSYFSQYDLDKDRNGVVRGQGGYDIGAYEYDLGVRVQPKEEVPMVPVREVVEENMEVPADTSDASSGEFTQGEQVMTTDRVNVRTTAGGEMAGTQEAGETGTVLGMAAREANGYLYIPIDFENGVDGWVAQDFVSRTSIESDAVDLPAESTEEEPIDPVADEETEETNEEEADPSPEVVNPRVQTTANLNVRNEPSGDLLGRAPQGSIGVQSIDVSPRTEVGYTWVYVTFNDGLAGYVASEYLTTENAAVAISDQDANLRAQIQQLLQLIEQLQARLNASMTE